MLIYLIYELIFCHIHLIFNGDMPSKGNCCKVNEEDKPTMNPDKLCKWMMAKLKIACHDVGAIQRTL